MLQRILPATFASAALAAVLIGLGAWMLPTARGIRIGAVGTALGAVSSAALWILTVSVLHQGEVVAIPLGVPGVFALAATAALLWLGTLGPTGPKENGANESDPAGSSPAEEG